MQPVGVALGPDLCRHELGEEGGHVDGGHHHDEDVAGLVVVEVLAGPEALERGGAEVLEGRFEGVGRVQLVEEIQPEPLKSGSKARTSIQFEVPFEAGKIWLGKEHSTEMFGGHEEVHPVFVVVDVLDDVMEDLGRQATE